MRKSWIYTRINQSLPPQGAVLTTARRFWRTFKSSLLDVPGAVMRRSCDSVSAGAEGDGVDRWDADTDLVWAADGSAHSWAVIRFGNMANAEFMIDLSIATSFGHQATLVWSPGGLFTGGSTTARPTATDEQVLQNDAVLIDAVEQGRALHVPFTSDGRTVMFVFYETSVPKTVGILHYSDEIADSTWLTRGLAGVVRAGDAGVFSGWSTTAALKGRFGAVNMAAFMTMDSWAASVSSFNSGNQASSFRSPGPQYDMIEIPLVSTTVGATGYIGRLPDVYWVQDTAHVNGDVLTAQNGQRYAVVGNLAFPWSAAAVYLIDTAPTPPAGKLGYPVASSSQVKFLAVSPAEGALNADPETARWTPIELTYDAPADGTSVIFAKVGNDPMFWPVVAIGTTISPLFAARSTLTMTSGRVVASVLPNGGWWRAPIEIVCVAGAEVS